MESRTLLRYLAILVVILVLVVLLYRVPLWLADPGEYDGATVSVADANGTDLATVEVRIADTDDKREIGLSRTDSLEMGEGMLFVHEASGQHTYVMRKMDFPLDIIFAAEDGTITTIHHAPVPEKIPFSNGNFPGRGKYVLEVPRGWSNATGVDIGDQLVIPPSVSGENESESSSPPESEAIAETQAVAEHEFSSSASPTHITVSGY